MIIDAPAPERKPSKQSLQRRINAFGYFAALGFLAGFCLLHGIVYYIADSTDNRHPFAAHVNLLIICVSLPFVIIAIAGGIYASKAKSQMNKYYGTIIMGFVVELESDQYNGYAVVQGINSCEEPLTEKFKVPLDVWTRPLQVGDRFPW